MADPGQRKPSETNATGKGGSPRTLRAPILIVDDHPSNLLAFEVALQDPRHDLVTAASGREALALAETTEFAAILLDVRMPDLNGYDTAAVLRRRSRTKSTPILFMTAFDAAPQEVSEAYAIGGTDFIRKPVDETMLRSKISVYVDLYFDRVEAREWAKDLTETAERRLRAIFEQMPVSLFTVNRDLRVTFADGRHVRAEGRVGGEIIGRRVTEFASEEERPRVEKAFRDALEGRAASYETTSGRFSCSAHVQPLYDRDKSIIGAICGFLDVTEQRAAEREVLEQKNLLQAFFHAASDAVFAKDASGRYLLVNEAGARLFGKAVPDIVGRTDFDLFPEAVARACAESDRRVLETGQAQATEAAAPFATGPHTYRLSKAPLRDSAGAIIGVVGTAHDVSDLIEAREQLRHSNDRFRLALVATNERLYDWDLKAARAVPSEGAREAWFGLLHPEDRPRVVESLERTLAGASGTWTEEYRLLHPDGRVSWTSDRAIIVRDASGRAERMIGAVADVTGQKESQVQLTRRNRDLETRIGEGAEALRMSQVRLMLALEGGDMGTWDLDPRTGTLAWSEPMMRILGFEPGKVVPSLELYRSLIHPDDLPRVVEELDHARRERGRYSLEYRIRRADTGEVRWVSSSARTVLNGRGEVVSLAGVLFDVTERRHGQDALREALEESDAFARTVSHELRAPLRAMGFSAQLLLEDLASDLDAEHKAQFERLIQAAQHLDAMTQDLLAYSRLARADLTLEPVCPGAVLGELMGRMEMDLRRQGASIRLEGPFPPVLGHRLSLEQALSNLLYNAIKFVAPGTSPDVVVRHETLGPNVRLWVEDNGIGISPEDQRRLFRVFERLAPRYPGTGVGLAIVRKCVERMRGKAGVESRPGGGSRFYVELPAARS